MDKIDKYFAEKGVKVIYNCLGHTNELISSYVMEFQDFIDSTTTQKSQHVKQQCYSTLYDIAPRKKFTGFEEHKRLDKQFRRDISKLITEPQLSPTLLLDTQGQSIKSGSYKAELKKFVKSIDNPLLYLSGGIDSELVALTMLDTGVKFTPIIFNYVNSAGQVLNLFDSSYAYKFCARHGLFPISKTINVEQLWSSSEFTKMAIDLQLLSPQLVTHAYMIQLMAEQFSDYTHVFGGEIRFCTHYQLDDGRMANLVSLAKVSPGYSGGTYTSTVTNPSATFPASVNLTYYPVAAIDRLAGYWYIVATTGNGATLAVIDSGAWTTTPAAGLYAISCLSVTRTLTGNGGGFPSAPTGYSTMNSDTTVANVSAGAGVIDSSAQVIAEFAVKTTSGAQTGIIMTSTITIDAIYDVP